MAQTAYGSPQKPVSLDHYQTIVGVGWGGQKVGVLEMIYVPGTSFVDIYDPPGFSEDNRYNSGDVVNLLNDIKDSYMVHTLVEHDEGPWRAENPIDSLVVDGFYNGPTSDTDALNAAKDSGTAAFGYPPNLTVVDAFAVFREDRAVEPDGSSYNYYGHYTIEHVWYAVTDGYGNPTIRPDPMIPYIGNTELVWYRHHIRPPVDYEKFKQNWFINFSTGKSKTIKIATALVICNYNLRIFNSPVKANLESTGSVTVVKPNGTPAVPAFSGSGSQANGPVRFFNANGFVV